MATELARHIEQTPLCDTHEHLHTEQAWLKEKPDILQQLFDNYARADLVTAGAAPEAVQALANGGGDDIRGRFLRVRDAWESMKHTGYGEAVRIVAEKVFGLHELTPEGLEIADNRRAHLQRPGGRLTLLRDVARLDHVQIDPVQRPCNPDDEDPNFFLYDLSWVSFSNADIVPESLYQETHMEVKDLQSLDEAMVAIFAANAPRAIALKTQHAYRRTLKWSPRERHDVEQALARLLPDRAKGRLEDRLCVGDWCLARGVELAIEYDLPIKIHTGYYAGNGNMPMERINPSHLCRLLTEYPKARFILMHIGYPYDRELLALAKHYPNVWVDLCWSWSIDTRSTADFVRRFIHAAPSNKLFVFGGDTRWPSTAVGYAVQCRRGLTRALQAEIDAGELTESEAIDIASRFMRENQLSVFDLARARAAHL